jgi:hypothetical protein
MENESLRDSMQDCLWQDSGDSMDASLVDGSDLVAKGAGIFGEATLVRRNDGLHQPFLLSAPDRGERNDSDGQ